MITIHLKDNYYVYLDDCDAHLANYRWSVSNGYAIRGHNIRMHHCIIGRKLNKQMVVDHKNGNRLDNRRQNLRHVTQWTNARNRDGSKWHRQHIDREIYRKLKGISSHQFLKQVKAGS